MHRLLLATLAVPALSACQQPECVSNSDCGIGNVCSLDSQCQTGIGSIGRTGSAALPPPVDVDDVLSQGSGTGEFSGNIGQTSSSGAANMTWLQMEWGSAIFQITLPEQPNTFVVLTFEDAVVLEQPGEIVVADPTSAVLTGTWVRACNYDDTNTYDEPLNDVVVELAPPDASGIVAMAVRLKGTGTEGNAVIPWLPPSSR